MLCRNISATEKPPSRRDSSEINLRRSVVMEREEDIISLSCRFVRVSIAAISSFTEFRLSMDEKAIRYQLSTNLSRVPALSYRPFPSVADLAFRASTHGVDNRSSREPLSARPNHHLSRSFDFAGICENKVPRPTSVFRWFVTKTSGRRCATANWLLRRESLLNNFLFDSQLATGLSLSDWLWTMGKLMCLGLHISFHLFSLLYFDVFTYWSLFFPTKSIFIEYMSFYLYVIILYHIILLFYFNRYVNRY